MDLKEVVYLALFPSFAELTSHFGSQRRKMKTMKVGKEKKSNFSDSSICLRDRPSQLRSEGGKGKKEG